MHLWEGIVFGMRALLQHKLRSLLTLLGIIIGIAAVLAMIAIGEGAKQLIIEDLEKIGGMNTFTLLRLNLKWERGHRIPVRSPEHFNYSDVLAIEAECPSVKVASPRIPQWNRVLMQAPEGRHIRAGYNGVDAAYITVMNWKIHTGRFISDVDVKNATKVVVLGANVTLQLFPVSSPLGKEIKIYRASGQYKQQSERFRVIGTLVPLGRSFNFGASIASRLSL
ncbi:MAG: ABC transporter permease [Gammaproteobacteria bacterium]|nr:ABC transporter permease [Gammaproteobacteria bacterium]